MVLKILRSPCLPLGSRICVGRCELRRCEWRNCDSCFLFPVGVIGTAGIQCTVPPQQQSADGCTCMPAAATVNHRHICLADDTPTVSCSFRIPNFCYLSKSSAASSSFSFVFLSSGQAPIMGSSSAFCKSAVLGCMVFLPPPSPIHGWTDHGVPWSRGEKVR